MHQYVYVVTYVHTCFQYINIDDYMSCALQWSLVSSYKFIINIQDYKLCSAAKAGNVTEVETLIQSGAHVDSTEVSLHNCKK